MTDLPTRNQAHAYLNHLRDIRGDLCIESCVHSVATNTAEHCLEAYVAGRLIDGQAIADAWKEVRQTDWEDFDAYSTALSKVDALLDALTEENK